MFLAMASLGLPGLGNFVAEFLILLGAFAVSPMLAGIAVLGLVAATVYALKMVQSAFHGPGPREWQINDLYVRELGVFAALIILLLWLGLYPQPVLDQAAAAIGHLEQQAVQLAEALR